jgi:hypothetical protein
MSDETKPSMPRKVALFRGSSYDSIIVLQLYGDGDDWSTEGYVRITEWQTVEFQPLPPAELCAVEMAALNAQRAKTVEEFTAKLSYIDGRIANLRALTGPEAV